MVCTGSASGMLQHTFGKAITAVLRRPWVIFHPELRSKYPLIRKNFLVRLGLYKQAPSSKKQGKGIMKEPEIGLVVIGVDPAFQGKGYGSMLLREFERRAFEDFGVSRLHLSVRNDNYQAIRAYEKNGWKRGKVEGNSLKMWKIVS